MQLCRSVLFVPSNLKNSFGKVLNGPADCIVFDLEDSVHFEKKEVARQNILEFFDSDAIRYVNSFILFVHVQFLRAIDHQRRSF